MLPTMTINYLAVLACAIVAMPVGFLWFGPLFGKAWARHMGFGDMQPPDAGSMGKSMAHLLRQQSADCVGPRPQPSKRGRPRHGASSPDAAPWIYAAERGLLQLAGIFLSGADEPRGVGA